MRLVAVAMVRDEADVIEAFVRHNLRVVDALTIIDHASQDATSSILAALVAEGLPLQCQRHEAHAQQQPELLTVAARAAFAGGADAVLPLDADEFLKVPDRPLLTRTLANIPAILNAALHWQTYVPDSARRATHPMRSATRRLATERHGLHKVVLTRAFASSPTAVLGPGNHTVLSEGPDHDLTAHPVQLARLPAAVAAIAHLPVRSSAQLCAKIATGWSAHQAAARANPRLAFHWRELHEEFARTGPPSADRLAVIAANYGLPMTQWLASEAIDLIDDPVVTQDDLRYDPVTGAALAR